MKTIRLKNNQINYPIFIGSGLYADIGKLCKQYIDKDRVFIISDSVVSTLYKPEIIRAFKTAKVKCIFISISVNEKKKNINTVINLSNRLFSYNVDRQDTVIAFGGGIIGDIVGLTASIVLRGIKYIQIPTTLLSQVDSSVGGKTGVNNIYGKNLIGSFYQPQAVIIDTDVLNTLPKRELLSGYAEIIKYGIIKDTIFFEWLQKNGKKIIEGDTAARIHAIHKSCMNKSKIVKADEKEHGIRALLNLGHTFGHAIESLNGFKKSVVHGEAVAIGIILAVRLSCIEGYTNETTFNKIITHFKEIGLPTQLPKKIAKLTAKNFVSEMVKDKKTINKNITLILVKDIGNAFIKKGISQSKLIKLHKEITT